MYVGHADKSHLAFTIREEAIPVWQDYLDKHKDRFIEELFDFIRIPSVSAQAKHRADVQRAASWVAHRLEQAGIEHVEAMPTGGHPVVYGDWLHAGSDKPTVLIYGHFDVQPPEPLELWESDPFEPTVRDGRIYARGASDDKSSMFTPIIAAEAILKTKGALSVNLKFCFEGQEEIGGPELAQLLEKHKGKFACDVVFSADGLQWSDTEGMIVLSRRGLAELELKVTAATSDLHSGLHGGVLHNPLEALARLIASLRDDTGRIAVAGFYDDVIDPTPGERDAIAKVPFDEDAYRSELGIPEYFGEPNYTTRERNWIRPTLDVNGMWGGYQGSGSKTVIPSEARAKITCRLVANQNPHTVLQGLKHHIMNNKPKGVTVEVWGEGVSEPLSVPVGHPGNVLIKDVLTELYGMEPYYTRLGGSIPVNAVFKEALGADMIGFGWSLASENLHAPNEFFPLEAFARGQRGYCLLFEKLAEYGQC